MKLLMCRVLSSLALFLLTSVQEAVSQPEHTPSQKEIAERVESVLRNAVCAEVVQEIHQVVLEEGVSVKGGTDPVRYRSLMGRGVFKSEVFDKDNRLIASFSLFNRRVQEYRPLEDLHPIFEYDAPFVNGTDKCIVSTDQDCLFAPATFSWVGVPNGTLVKEDGQPYTAIDTAASMRKKIEEGIWQPDVQESSRPCYVFRQEFPVANGTIVNVVYVDKETYLVLRWDTFEPSAHRIRTNKIQLLPDLPKDYDWKIKVTK